MAATLLAAPGTPGGAITDVPIVPRQSTSHGVSSTFVSISPENRTLAVLPFRHRGAAEHSYLAEALAEDLVDVLATIQGLRVTASGATAKYEGRSVDEREAGSCESRPG